MHSLVSLAILKQLGKYDVDAVKDTEVKTRICGCSTVIMSYI